MLLPTGEVLFSASSNNFQVYTPDGGPQEAWRPTIATITPHHTAAGDYYLLKGTQLNGLSQANMFGDDCATATNYPLVRLRNTATNAVYFCRTYHFSTMGVATGASLQSTRFRLPSIPCGEYDLCVIANGIRSHCVSFCYRGPRKPCCHDKAKADPCCCEEHNCCDREPECCHEIVELRDHVKRLQNSMTRLAAVVGGEKGVGQPKDLHSDEEKGKHKS